MTGPEDGRGEMPGFVLECFRDQLGQVGRINVSAPVENITVVGTREVLVATGSNIEALTDGSILIIRRWGSIALRFLDGVESLHRGVLADWYY